ncbi:hypothetical protein GLOTRDRAFT_118212 [Gloeophyllum trabeum ATCC 11539]|uniref:Zn(2)-C6 fungal-type domain-containing protein n=1 Tax=Gloeophyllum trabeum (strain ATCC 11539 / FP-39264 / Madison 617) TaxID=670483 RepID=S7R950_GLOTA|nr:uncharacterized protein GLOTRDRAFT_118212 [Gloeophyllum trabeum ATCC 11539]EPQ50825.1 hypothetical protein GLOTRDRAFT_118212 [Gloeophyllum trabeum ATCC 11539]
MMSSFTSSSKPTEYSRIAPRNADVPAPIIEDQSKRPAVDDASGPGKKKAKRRKVNHACLYCRRSHMTCDEGRPCQRCIKREIGHLCHDEPRQSSKPDKSASSSVGPNIDMSRAISMNPFAAAPVPVTNPVWPIAVAPAPYLAYQPETLGNEFSVLTDFLESLDERSFFNPPPTTIAPPLVSVPSFSAPNTVSPANTGNSFLPKAEEPAEQPSAHQTSQSEQPSADKPPNAEDGMPPPLSASNKTEQFLYTAADQEPGTRDERLRRVISAKYEAGLLKPYNYVKGYARLSRWMDRNVSQESKQLILQPLSVLRPKFRAIAQSLKDMDLVFIEEAFERLLLDYDRVFSVMGVPACLWRRTGEIYKGNREFAELVGVDGYMLRDGRLCIYELMAEESAVNYWEKYGHVAFDANQKAVLTSCVLRFKPLLSPPSGSISPVNARKPTKSQELVKEEGFINCCFSFTIRRDAYGIPSMIVGNFIKC